MIVRRRGSHDRLEVHDGPRLLDAGLSIVHPFFNERARFDLQFDLWLSWPKEIRKKVQIVLVDDCSPSPVHSWLTKSKVKRLNRLNLMIYRITTNLKYNTPGALNLAFTTAPSPFVLTMDSDCAFDVEQIQKVADMTPLDTMVYKFDRSRIGTGEASSDYSGNVVTENLAIERFLPCTMLMHKNVFWQTGGFDEDYTGERSGGYGFFDSDFDRRLDDLHILWCVSDDITVIEWMPSACDGEICIRSNSHHKIARRLYRLKRHLNPDRKNEWLTQNREILRFQWKRTHWSRYEE